MVTVPHRASGTERWLSGLGHLWWAGENRADLGNSRCEWFKGKQNSVLHFTYNLG